MCSISIPLLNYNPEQAYTATSNRPEGAKRSQLAVRLYMQSPHAWYAVERMLLTGVVMLGLGTIEGNVLMLTGFINAYSQMLLVNVCSRPARVKANIRDNLSNIRMWSISIWASR